MKYNREKMVERGRAERNDGKKTEQRKETKYDKREGQRKKRNRKEMRMARVDGILGFLL